MADMKQIKPFDIGMPNNNFSNLDIKNNNIYITDQTIVDTSSNIL